MDNGNNIKIDNDDLIQILSLIDSSDFDQCELSTGDFKLIVRKSNCAETIIKSEESQPHQLGKNEDRNEFDASHEMSSTKSSREIAADREPSESAKEGLLTIRAPMIGTFYRAPSPGAKAFVEVGDKVNENDIVCIIEVMKVMSSVKAGVQGRVVKILAENGVLVEYGQSIFLIEPEQNHEAH